MRRVRHPLLVVGAATLGVALYALVALRKDSPAVQDVVRSASKRFLNPLLIQTAGQRCSYASIIRHVGRTTGHRYDTPVQIARRDDEYFVATPYGDRADWVRNVLAAGSAQLLHEAETIDVVDAELVSIEDARGAFGQLQERAHRVFNVDVCVHVRRRPAAPGSGE